jgi:endo-1,4-beta-xylanase
MRTKYSVSLRDAWAVSLVLALGACATAADDDAAAPATGGSAAGAVSTAGATTTQGGSKATGGTPGGAGQANMAGRAGSAGSGGDGGANSQAGSASVGGSAGVGGSSGNAGVAGLGGKAGAGGAAGNGGTAGSDGSSGAPPIGKKFVGNIDTRTQIRSDFTKYWNQFTPENAGKWGSIEGKRNEMNWTNLDRMHDYAKQHNVLFKQHNFVWGSQQPGWLSGLSQADQRAEVEEWIRLYCERYPDTPFIDVVNEPPPHTTPPYVQALGGAGASGYDWIAQVFKWAGQYCPNSVLILNDYNNIEYQNDNAHSIDIANKIKAAGAPIDAIGAQAHDAYKMSTSSVQQYIDKIKSQTGLPVYISEYDIDIADDNQQKNVMQSQFTMFWNDENVKGITLWGYINGMTWKANTGLVSSSGTPRPALTWLLDFVGN